VRKDERAAQREIGGKTNEPRNKRAPAHERIRRGAVATWWWGQRYRGTRENFARGGVANMVLSNRATAL